MGRLLHPIHAWGGIAKPTDELRTVEDYQINRVGRGWTQELLRTGLERLRAHSTSLWCPAEHRRATGIVGGPLA